MLRNLTKGLLILTLTGVGATPWDLPSASAAEVQLGQNAAEGEARRALKELDHETLREREDDKQKEHDASEQAQKDRQLNREESARDSRASEAVRHRDQRKARVKALIKR